MRDRPRPLRHPPGAGLRIGRYRLRPATVLMLSAAAVCFSLGEIFESEAKAKFRRRERTFVREGVGDSGIAVRRKEMPGGCSRAYSPKILSRRQNRMQGGVLGWRGGGGEAFDKMMDKLDEVKSER